VFRIAAQWVREMFRMEEDNGDRRYPLSPPHSRFRDATRAATNAARTSTTAGAIRPKVLEAVSNRFSGRERPQNQAPHDEARRIAANIAKLPV
jgi:hypothetical protein